VDVLDAALAQISDVHRHGTPVLIRSDSTGCTHGFLAHIRGLRANGIDARFSVGVAITWQSATRSSQQSTPLGRRLDPA